MSSITDEVVVELETDKAAVELPAPVSGTLVRIIHAARGGPRRSATSSASLTSSARRSPPPPRRRPAPWRRRDRTRRRLPPQPLPGAAAVAVGQTRAPARGGYPRSGCHGRRPGRQRTESRPHAGDRARAGHAGAATRAVARDGAVASGERTPRGRTDPDDPPAQGHRRQARGGTARRGTTHDVQRSRHDRGERAAGALQGRVPQTPRHQARVHVVLREGRRGRPADRAGRERAHRRDGHHLPQVPGHRNRRRRRARTARARAAERRVDEPRRHRAGDCRLRHARDAEQDQPLRTPGRHVHDHERRGLWLAAVDTLSSTRRNPASSACMPSRTGRWRSTGRWSCGP